MCPHHSHTACHSSHLAATHQERARGGRSRWRPVWRADPPNLQTSCVTAGETRRRRTRFFNLDCTEPHTQRAGSPGREGLHGRLRLCLAVAAHPKASHAGLCSSVFGLCSTQRILPQHQNMISSSEAVAVPRAAAPCVDQAAAAVEMPSKSLMPAAVPRPGRRLLSRQRGDETSATQRQSTWSGATTGDQQQSFDSAHEHCSLGNTITRKLSRTSTPCLLGTAPRSADSDESHGLRKNRRPRRSFSCPTRSRKTQKFATDTVVGRPSAR